MLGPIIGGFFAGAPEVLGITGWRWIFLVNVPFGILGMVVITRVLHLPPLAKVFHRIDWPGGLALAGGLERFAATKRIQLRRSDPATGQERLYLFNFNAVERGAAIQSMITMREGDVIVVPERRLFE